ncbi:MAG: hypothetical protein K8T89_11360 [Planctomycetes bacterium]|nr:hypothetical protein [Planctomycetota bacterium]
MLTSGGAKFGRHFFALLCAMLVYLPLAAQNQPKKDTPKSAALKLPSGAIIVVARDSDSIDKPEAIYLTPEKFKELSDQIEALKKQVAVDKPMPPTNCELDASLEKRGTQTIVKIKATFRFQTTQPRAVVFLGCSKAQPVEAKLEDGKLPLLIAGERGLSVQVDAAGSHVVQLDLEAPLQSRGPKGSEIGFELGLPGAAITSLLFDAPASVKRVTISRREAGNVPLVPLGADAALDIKRIEVARLKARGGEALGAITFLGVSWEDTAQPRATVADRSADADVQVTINDTDILTDAQLRLKGTAKEWRFLAPNNAEVKIGRAPPLGSPAKPIDFPADQAPDVVRPEPGKSEWRVRFAEPNSAELMVVINTRALRNRTVDPKSKGGVPVGPFAALDVAAQSGTIRVKTPPHIRATPILKGDTQRLDSGDDPNAEAVYRYRTLPTGGKDLYFAPLELDIRSIAGTIQARVHHFLTLGEGGWRLRSEITITPIRTEVETLDLEVPVPGVFETPTPKLVEAIVPLRDIGPTRRVIQIKLTAPQRNEFTLTIDGFYSLPLGAQEATLVMPRLLNIAERGNQVSVAIPDGFDVRGGAYQWEIDKPGTKQRPLEITPDRASISSNIERAVAQVELAWKPIRADVRLESTADVTLGDRQARIAQQCRYTFADRPSRRLRLRSLAPLTGVSVTPGSIENNGPNDWTVILPAEPSKETSITLNYAIAYASTGNEPFRLNVPLLWPENATAADSRVRFLRDREATSHWLPTLDAGPWQVLPIEILPAETTLLGLRGTGLNLPLSILMTDAEMTSHTMPLIWIDRTLIQAQADDVNQKYRARFHVAKWKARYLDLELPTGAAEIELRINGIRTDALGGQTEGEAGRTIRVPLPLAKDRQPLMIEVKYATTIEGGHWITRWKPPRPLGRVALAGVRWQVAVPMRNIPLSMGDAVFEERWNVRNGFALPVATYSTADLDKWILNGLEPDGREASAGWELSDAGVSARQHNLETLRFVSMPRNLWLASVSLLVLIVGLLLSRLAKQTAGLLIALIGIAAVVVGLLWPQPAGQTLAAAQPGLAILALVLGMQRYLQWRYRRRLARMPGFTRIHAESAVARSNGKRVIRETSTVDSPAGR